MFSLFFAGKTDPAVVENGPYKPFTLPHVVITVCAFLFIIILIRYFKQKKYKIRFIAVVSAFILMVLLNMLRFVWEWGIGQFSLKQDLPLQLCGLQLFILPFALFSRNKLGDYLREFAYVFGTLGFIFALLLPFTTAYDYPVFHFRTLQSVLYHSALGFVALMLPYLGYQPDIKNIRKAYAVFASVGATAAVNIIIGSNYLYTAYLPLPVQPIAWPYYLPLMLAFIMLTGRLPYYMYYIFEKRAYKNNKDIHQL